MLSFVNAAAARAASLRGPEDPEPGHPAIGRRQWLATAAVGLCGAAGLTLAAPPGAFAAESDRDAPRSPAEGARLLDRLTWGANAAALEGLQRVGPAATVAALLRPAPNAPLPPEAQAQIDAMAITRTPMETLAIDMQARQQAIKNEPTEDARKAAQDAYQRDMRALQREAERRFVLRAVYSRRRCRRR